MIQQFPKKREELEHWFEKYVGRGAGKITETELAYSIGVAQKTVSRYCHGESYPSERIRGRIIEEIEKALFPKEDLSLINSSLDTPIEEFWNDDIYARQDQELAEMFCFLKRGQQLLMLRNPQLFTMSFTETNFIWNFNKLNQKKRAEIIEFMMKFNVTYKQIVGNPFLSSRLRLCMRMIDELENIDIICKKDDRSKTIIEDEFLYNNANYPQDDEMQVACEAVSLTAYDWYVLRLLTICGMNDTNPVHYEMDDINPVTEFGVGEIVHGLFNYVKTEAEKGNDKQ